MPKSGSRSTKSSSPHSPRSKSAPSRAATKKPIPSSRTTRTRRPGPPSNFSWGSLSLDRKLDILGIFLALIGLLTVLSLLSSERGPLTGFLITTLNQIAGWGSFVLPLGLIGIGLWLVFRKMDRLPVLSFERTIGILLLYLNLLTWLHLFGRGGSPLADGGGGGLIGGFFLNLLTSTIGYAGGVIVQIAWLVLAIVFTFDLSIPEIYRRLQPFFVAWGEQIGNRLNRPASSGPPTGRIFSPPHSAPGELPPDFNPLPGRSPSNRPTKKPATGHQDIPDSVEATRDDHGEPTPPGPTVTRRRLPAIPWVLPPLDQILDPATPAAQQTNLDQERARLIEETLASFGAPAHVVDISRGPTITRFGVEPDFLETRSGRTRVRVSKISSLADDLALALAASRIRIQAPVPGRAYVGIEVPNTEISRVAMREVLESDSFKRMRSPLRFAIGKDVAGKPISTDLTTLPHLLIAGTTGSGKSVCVNSLLTCLLLNNTPVDLRLVLVDPKRVELTGYNGIPHLLTPVVVDTERVIGALQWLQREMDARYHKFSSAGARNIQDYNHKHNDHLPYLVAVIDELADLMMLAPDETERAITRLAQLARATGIHLILATQRPSVDVVTGLIKANFPARIAFAVASSVDSRVILDQPGAERLLGRGDMLFQAPDAPAPVRLQGVYVADPEIQRLVDFWRTQASSLHSRVPASDETQPMVDMLPPGIPLKQGALWDTKENADPLLAEAIDLVRREGRASITMLQRRLRIGYTRAARMVDLLEDKGVVSPALPNSQVREILDYGPTAPPKDD